MKNFFFPSIKASLGWHQDKSNKSVGIKVLLTSENIVIFNGTLDLPALEKVCFEDNLVNLKNSVRFNLRNIML